MRWTDILRLTVLQYRENRLRNFLCALAVTVGVFSLVLLSNIGSFAAAQVTGMLDEIGLQGMTVFLKDSKNGEALSTAFAACMEEQVENVDSVTPVKFAGGTYQKGHRSGNVALIGATESVWETLDLEFLYGQGFVDGDMVDVQNPIVISDRFARELFSRDNIVGKQFYITIDGHQDRYTVIGVVRDQLEMFGGILGSFIPELAYVPLDVLSPSGKADQILFSSDAEASEMEEALQTLGGDLLGMQSTLSVQNLTGFLDQIRQAARQVQWFFLFISGFSILVALFAIENSMLSAIQEMREEFVLYRVIGLRKTDIVRLIFAQSTGVCLLGSALGILLGAEAVWLIRAVLLPGFTLAFENILFIVPGAVLFGMLSGILPAAIILRRINKVLSH